VSLPKWFILQAPPNLNIDVKEWKKLAWRRVELLEQLPNDPSQVVRDNFPYYEDNIDQLYEDYRLGAYLLRLVAATNRRLEAWLIESEGDLFEKLYLDRANKEEKQAIFERIFGSENVMSFHEFKGKMDENNNEQLKLLYHQYATRRGARFSRDFLICVHFTKVPWMVSKRKGYLRKGWVVSNEASFRGSLKKAFEKLFQQEIVKGQSLLGIREDIDEAVQDIEKRLAEHTQIRSRFGSDDLEGQLLHTHPEIFPPCMIFLSSELEKTGRLIHTHRLQLGFFLKKVGMSVDEQLNYWFEKSVDNVNVSYNEFLRTSGYQIRHLYGLEGGRKDYNVPKCSTIATSYFCPFVHLSPAVLMEFLEMNYLTKAKSLNISKRILEGIVSRSANDPTAACSRYFATIYSKSPGRKIVHPLQWVRMASKITGVYKTEEKEKSEDNSEER